MFLELRELLRRFEVPTSKLYTFYSFCVYVLFLGLFLLVSFVAAVEHFRCAHIDSTFSIVWVRLVSIFLLVIELSRPLLWSGEKNGGAESSRVSSPRHI